MRHLNVGDVVSGFEVMAPSEKSRSGGRTWMCRCVLCGVTRAVTTSNLNAERARCACSHAPRSRPRKDAAAHTVAAGRPPHAHGLTVGGITRTLREWSEQASVPLSTLHWRMRQRRIGHYQTDEEVLYGKRPYWKQGAIAHDWSNAPRRDALTAALMTALSDMLFERVAQDVQVATSRLLERLRLTVQRVVLDTMSPTFVSVMDRIEATGFKAWPDDVLRTAQAPARSIGEDAHANAKYPNLHGHTSSSDAELSALDAALPAHVDDNVFITHVGMTVREYRLLLPATTDEEIAGMVELARMGGGPVPPTKLDEPAAPTKLAEPAAPTKLAEPAAPTKLAEPASPTDSLSDSEIDYYLSAPWWAGEYPPVVPSAPCRDQAERETWLTHVGHWQYEWMHVKSDHRFVTFREVNDVVDVELMKTWWGMTRSLSAMRAQGAEHLHLRAVKLRELVNRKDAIGLWAARQVESLEWLAQFL